MVVSGRGFSRILFCQAQKCEKGRTQPKDETECYAEYEDYAYDYHADIYPIDQSSDRSGRLRMSMQKLGILEITFEPDRKEIANDGNGSYHHIDDDV